MEEYKRAEKEVRNKIRTAKWNFEKRLASGGEKNRVTKRQFYAYVKQRTKYRPSIGPLKDRSGRVVQEERAMVDLFNEFFSSVFTREDVSIIPEPQQQNQRDMLSDVKITTKKVKEKIRKLRKGAAAGPDKIGSKLLHELIEEVSSPLATDMRKTLEDGAVPEDWRMANVKPIYKKGAKHSPGNYHPVSLTSVCCKMMESILKDDIVEHLRKQNLINTSQHGFMQGKSCTSNLLSFLEKVTASVDSGVPVDVVYLDFAKAFDRVPVERLLKKVRAQGIRGKLYNWISAWLKDRWQRVVLNGTTSDWMAVLSGVPQGSVLGPLLFLIIIIYLNQEAARAAIVIKFADDTKVAQPISCKQDRDALQAALDGLVGWVDRWGMAFNVAKCKVMHIGHGNPRHATITFLSSYTITYVRPHLEFAVRAWSPWTVADREVPQQVQQRAVRMVSGLQCHNYEERLAELNLTTLEERRHQADMIMAYKILTHKDDVDPDEWFDMAAQVARVTRTTVDPLNVRVRHGRLDIRRHFFSVRVTENWNRVPSDIKKVRTVEGFKNAYAKHRRNIAHLQSWADANVLASSRSRRESILTTQNAKTRHR